MNQFKAIEADSLERLKTQDHHDVIIIGAGMSGLYQLHQLRKAGFDVVAIDRNADVGGTWFNNRYPGCRFDSESYTYGFSFEPELLEDWDWNEMFSPQPDNYKYTQFVAERLQLRSRILLETEIKVATFDDQHNRWQLEMADGTKKTCQFLITALGGLSTPTKPRLPGMDSFAGPSFHTFDWPHDPIDLSGKRVGIIGTGATGVQVIQTIASEVDELYVFQRRPNWCAPLNNRILATRDMDDIRSRYDDIFERCRVSPGGFEHEPDRRGFFEVSREERLKLWDELYDQPGFTILTGNFVEIFTNEEANQEFTEYIANRIRQRVTDPDVARNLIPDDHGFGIQRIPLEIDYYEQYNRPNVHLIPLLEEPISEVTPEGIKTSNQLYELDVIVYATGFDAGIGAFNKIEFQGLDGQRLSEKWANGPSTYLGMMTSGFPNMLHPVGPQSGGSSINFPRAIEMCTEWATDFLTYLRSNDLNRFNATQKGEDDWCEEARRAQRKLLLRKAMNYSTGINANIEGRDKQFERPLGYVGGNPKYRRFLDNAANSGYEDIDLQ